MLNIELETGKIKHYLSFKPSRRLAIPGKAGNADRLVGSWPRNFKVGCLGILN
jgi:hypothetical protein